MGQAVSDLIPATWEEEPTGAPSPLRRSSGSGSLPGGFPHGVFQSIQNQTPLRPSRAFGREGVIALCRPSPLNPELLAGCCYPSGSVYVYNNKTGEQAGETLVSPGGPQTALCASFSPNRTATIAVGYESGEIYIFDWKRGIVITELQGHTALLWSLSYCPTQPDILASAGGKGDETVRIWRTDSKHIGRTNRSECLAVLRAPIGLGGPFYSVCFSPSGTRILATTSLSNSAFLFEVADVLRAAEEAKMARDSEGMFGGSLGVPSREAGTAARHSNGGAARAAGPGQGMSAFDPGAGGDHRGREAAGAGSLQADLPEIRTRFILSGHASCVFHGAFAPTDESLAATCDAKGVARIWHLPTRACLAVLQGHSNGIKTVEFSPSDAGLCATASYDGTVRLWNWRNQGKTPLRTQAQGRCTRVIRCPGPCAAAVFLGGTPAEHVPSSAGGCASAPAAADGAEAPCTELVVCGNTDRIGASVWIYSLAERAPGASGGSEARGSSGAGPGATAAGAARPPVEPAAGPVVPPAPSPQQGAAAGHGPPLSAADT